MNFNTVRLFIALAHCKTTQQTLIQYSPQYEMKLICILQAFTLKSILLHFKGNEQTL